MSNKFFLTNKILKYNPSDRDEISNFDWEYKAKHLLARRWRSLRLKS